jgi:hypothetical protein
MLSAPSTADLADFTGTDVSEYSAFAGQALAQATLLFELASGLTEYPTDAAQYALAINGICEMADKIYSSQPYAQALNSPFQSESIGSYSYSKAQKALSRGDLTGVAWFDLALQRLAVRPLVEASASTLFETMPEWPADTNLESFDRPFG